VTVDIAPQGLKGRHKIRLAAMIDCLGPQNMKWTTISKDPWTPCKDVAVRMMTIEMAA
jgi:hypothetical protein